MDERLLLVAIEKLIRKRLAVIEEQPFRSTIPQPKPTSVEPPKPRPQFGRPTQRARGRRL
jgi:hypothetical protein